MQDRIRHKRLLCWYEVEVVISNKKGRTRKIKREVHTIGYNNGIGGELGRLVDGTVVRSVYARCQAFERRHPESKITFKVFKCNKIVQWDTFR